MCLHREPRTRPISKAYMTYSIKTRHLIDSSQTILFQHHHFPTLHSFQTVTKHSPSNLRAPTSPTMRVQVPTLFLFVSAALVFTPVLADDYGVSR
jgi:hypothetical protein